MAVARLIGGPSAGKAPRGSRQQLLDQHLLRVLQQNLLGGVQNTSLLGSTMDSNIQELLSAPHYPRFPPPTGGGFQDIFPFTRMRGAGGGSPVPRYL